MSCSAVPSNLRCLRQSHRATANAAHHLCGTPDCARLHCVHDARCRCRAGIVSYFRRRLPRGHIECVLECINSPGAQCVPPELPSLFAISPKKIVDIENVRGLRSVWPFLVDPRLARLGIVPKLVSRRAPRSCCAQHPAKESPPEITSASR